MAKSSVITASERTEFRICASVSIPGHHAAEPLSHKSDGCCEKKGNQEQEANDQDKAEGEDPILDNAENAPPRLWLHVPDCIERGLQLPENARCTKKQRHNPDKGRNNTRSPASAFAF